jgi:phage-related minor tail protein
VTKGIEDSFVNFAKTGKLSVKDLFSSIVETILRSQVQQLLAQTFGGFGKMGGGGGGSFLGSLFAGFFANGGSIPAGKFGVVGESGAELVSGPATVTPMNALGGGGGAMTVTYNINAVDAASFQSLVARDPEFLFAVTEQGRRRLPQSRR